MDLIGESLRACDTLSGPALRRERRVAEVEVVHSEGDEVDKGERDVDDEGVEEDEADE